MKREPGFYWAKHPQMDQEEVVEFSDDNISVFRTMLTRTYQIKDFEWVDDKPISVKKMPINLKADHYYVIKKKCGIANKPFMAKYSECANMFIGNAEQHYRPEVEIISGPFSIEQLTNLKPC